MAIKHARKKYQNKRSWFTSQSSEENTYFDINTIKMDKDTKEVSVDSEEEGYKI